jgi:hypothetical protein
VDDSRGELDRLNEELQAALNAFTREFTDWTALNVPIPTVLGRLRNFKMSALLLAWIASMLNLACFVAGLVFTFQSGVISTAGVAMVVGALFSEGAFVGQLWAYTAQSEHAMNDRLWGHEAFAHLKQLRDKINDLSKRIDRFNRRAAESDAID